MGAGQNTTLIGMSMGLSALVWIWYLVKVGIEFIPSWLWCVVASVSGTFFGVLLSKKKIRKRRRILAIVVTLAALLISTFGVYHLTETKQEKRLKKIIEGQQGTIEFQREFLKRQTILVDTRVKVGENPHFISGDFVDDRPLIEVLLYGRPFSKDVELTNIIKDISLTNTDEGVTIHSKKFDYQPSTARPKENLSAGHYVANLTVVPSISWRTQSGEFEKIEGEPKIYQTEFIVAKEFGIENFFIWTEPIKYPFWNFSALEKTISYTLTKSASSVDILVRNPSGKLIHSTERVYDSTTAIFIPEIPPGHAGYNEYPLVDLPFSFFLVPFLSPLSYSFELKVKKDKKEISAITFFLREKGS